MPPLQLIHGSQCNADSNLWRWIIVDLCGEDLFPLTVPFILIISNQDAGVENYTYSASTLLFEMRDEPKNIS